MVNSYKAIMKLMKTVVAVFSRCTKQSNDPLFQ